MNRLVLILILLSAQAESSPPFPSTDQIIHGLLARSAAEATEEKEFQQRYAYTELRIREERTPNGLVRNRSEQRRSHPPAPGHPSTNPAADGSTPPDHDAAEPARTRAHDRREVRLTEEVLRRFDYLPRAWETIEGRPALRVDFRAADRELPHRQLLDRFINRMQGTLWLDAADYRILQAQMRLSEKVSFVGGLIGAVYSLESRLERAATPDGYWYVRRSEWHVDYREFLTRRIVDFQETLEQLRPTEASIVSRREPAAASTPFTPHP